MSSIGGWAEWAVVAVAVLVAATAQYTAGFGFALLGVPLMATAIDTHDAVIITVWLGLVTSSLQAIEGRRVLDRAVTRRLSIGTLLGVPIGSTVFVLVAERTLTIVLGVCVIVAVVVLARGFRLTSPSTRPEWIAGVVSGALASSLATNGPPLVAVLQARGFPISVFRATINTVFALANVLALIAFALTGDLEFRQLVLSATTLPLLGVGVLIGLRLRRSIDEPRARQVVLGLLALAGVSALVSAITG